MRRPLGLTHALEMARAGFTTVRDLGGDTCRRHRRARRDRAKAAFPVRASRSRAIRCRSSAAMPTMPPALPPELAAAVDDAQLRPAVCTGVEECQKVGPQAGGARRRRDQDHGHRRRARSRRDGPRAAFHRCRDEGDRRHGPLACTSRSRPMPMARAASRRRPTRASIRSSTARSSMTPARRR